MEEPEFTCPSIDDLMDDFKEIKDTSVLEDELKGLTTSILDNVKNQYSYYIDKVESKLEKIRSENAKLREWGSEKQKAIDEARLLIKLGFRNG